MHTPSPRYLLSEQDLSSEQIGAFSSRLKLGSKVEFFIYYTANIFNVIFTLIADVPFSTVIPLYYRISSYSFRGNYSFLNLEIQRSQCIRPKVTVHKGAATIQGRKLYEEIR